MKFQDSHSGEQLNAEKIILETLKQQYFTGDSTIHFGETPSVLGVKLDGYSVEPLVLVEIWARVGKAIGAHPDKVMSDFAKMVLIEKMLGRKGRKIFAVICEDAIRFLQGKSWYRKFADVHDIEIVLVKVPEALKTQIRMAQVRQASKMPKKLKQRPG